MEKDKNFSFEDLIVLDMANNHQGELGHGINIINELSKKVNKFNLKVGIKFQFRQLDSFIHPNHKKNSNAKHISRFLETELKIQEYEAMLKEVKKNNFLSICTPFDEKSVEIIDDMNFDLIKIASCSANDWPLIEKISEFDRPVICSTGGLTLSQIDDIHSYFKHKNMNFALMHCVSIYPTPLKNLQLNQIDLLKSRYPDITIGWSTHEDQDELSPVQIAFGKGARMFERHVGLETDEIKLNKYSSNPLQVENWFNAIIRSKEICGHVISRPETTLEEKKALESLQRGVYSRKNLKKGEFLNSNSIYFAMPYEKGQLKSSEFKNGIKLEADLKKDGAIFLQSLKMPLISKEMILKKAIHEVKAMLAESKIILNSEFEVEYSHHYGIENFRDIGVVIINVINREYCKKILVQLPNQKHPSHHHKMKEETFQILSGTLNAVIDGKKRTLFPGDISLVMPGVWHSFSTETGCIFEEVSTTHFNNDSVYQDKKINDMKRSERKTIVDHWGRYQTQHYIQKNV